MDFKRRDNPSPDQPEFKWIALNDWDATAVHGGLVHIWRKKIIVPRQRIDGAGLFLDDIVARIGHGDSVLNALDDVQHYFFERRIQRTPELRIVMDIGRFCSQMYRRSDKEVPSVETQEFHNYEADIAVAAVRRMAEYGSPMHKHTIQEHAEKLVAQLDS